MDPVRSWIAASRPGRALLAPCCVGVGVAYARFDVQQGRGFIALVLVSLGAFAAALGVQLIDHAWEQLGAPPPDPKSRPSARIGPVDAQTAAVLGIAAIVFSALCGLGLGRISGPAALGYGLLAVILGALRGMPVVGLDALGWGLAEGATFVALGPLAALAGFASQTGHGTWGAVIAGMPAGLVATSAFFGRHATRAHLESGDYRRLAVALPLLAAGAVAIAVRAGDYGAWANAAAIPLAVTSVAVWRLLASPTESERARWERLVFICSVLALLAIVVAFLVDASA